MKEVKSFLKECDVLIVIGTSFEVSPADILVKEIADECKMIVIDPNPNRTFLNNPNTVFIERTATEGVLELNDYF